ncbi:MAG: sulfatase [Acidobacteriota bacterium]
MTLRAFRRRLGGKGQQQSLARVFGLAWIGGLSLLLGCQATTPPEPSAPPKRPNVLLIVVDTLRADHLGFLGYERSTSPHLDRFAADAITFKQAIAHAPWTSPSIGALLTSQYPGALGFADSKEPARVDDDVLFLAEILRQHDYPTTAIISHTYLGTRIGFQQGFDRFDEDNALGPNHVSSVSVTDKAIAFLDETASSASSSEPSESSNPADPEPPAAADPPFFLFLHYFDPHFAYRRHEGFDFYPDYQGDVRSGEPYGSLLERAREESISDDDLTFIRALYDSEIRFTDLHLGRLLDELKRRGLYDDALILFTADHGEAFLDRKDRWIGHGKTLFQELIHVPLLIKLPGGAGGGTVVDTPVGLIDVLPSTLELLDIPFPEAHRFEGRTLPLSDREALLSLPPAPVFSETLARNRWLQSIIEGRWKLIFNRKTAKPRLFDLEADPLETTNLASHEPETLRRLSSALRAWSERIDERRGQAGAPATFSPEEQERLRALGYLP